MSKSIFIIGGARSGKSSFANQLANRLSKDVVYIATGEAGDGEMAERIKQHRKNRRPHWRTIEEPMDPIKAMRRVKNKNSLILIDCLTLLISNWLLSNWKDKDVYKYVKRLLSAVKKMENCVILVSNEVGMGIVPENRLAREFRDIAGRANQMVAKEADEVYFVVAGMPVKLKYR